MPCHRAEIAQRKLGGDAPDTPPIQQRQVNRRALGMPTDPTGVMHRRSSLPSREGQTMAGSLTGTARWWFRAYCAPWASQKRQLRVFPDGIV